MSIVKSDPIVFPCFVLLFMPNDQLNRTASERQRRSRSELKLLLSVNFDVALADIAGLTKYLKIFNNSFPAFTPRLDMVNM